MHKHQSFARFVAAPENRAAMLAVHDLAANFSSDRSHPANPLFLHGPSGTGKSHLVSALVREVTRSNPGAAVCVVEAGALVPNTSPPTENQQNSLAVAEGTPGTIEESARSGDLLIVEDLQHLSPRSVEGLVQLMDYRLARQRPMVLTAWCGPQQLAARGLSNRLTSRLGAGLVVSLQPLQAASRLLFLQEQAQRRQLALATDVLTWLAENLTGGGRQLEGALNQLQLLARMKGKLDVDFVAGSLGELVEAGRPTVERIAQRVSGHFRVEARQLQSRRRHRNALLPRQIGMYLARQLTRLSLEQIGAYFGGRDHSTVLHACRKVAQAMDQDAVLSGTVRQIHADLA